MEDSGRLSNATQDHSAYPILSNMAGALKLHDHAMLKEEAAIEEPVSPTGQYFTSSAISISVIGVLESEIPIEDSQAIKLLQEVFIPINPRFSSVMVKDKRGIKHWKKVEVKVGEHVNIPTFLEGKSTEFYEECFSEYLSKIAMEPFSQSRPLWEIHIVKYPTRSAAGNLVFKLHHALGDGYSLMGALLSCLRRADNPEIPLTFPTTAAAAPNPKLNPCTSAICRAWEVFAHNNLINTVKDFGWSLLKSTFLEDEKSPIRSGEDGVEFRPIVISTLTFDIHQIKQVKSILHATINDVICGVVFLGIRLYMQEVAHSQRNAKSTALVLLNTRAISGYRSISEMVKPGADSPWGNNFAFLHVSLPEMSEEYNNSINCKAPVDPLSFVLKAQDIIRKKKNSSAVLLTGKLLDTICKLRGAEVTAKYVHSTLKKTSITVSNMTGPVERMALSNHPVKGLYFMVAGVPQSLTITMISYAGQLRLAVGTEKKLIDAPKLISCLQNAFDVIFKAAISSLKMQGNSI